MARCFWLTRVPFAELYGFATSPRLSPLLRGEVARLPTISSSEHERVIPLFEHGLSKRNSQIGIKAKINWQPARAIPQFPLSVGGFQLPKHLSRGLIMLRSLKNWWLARQREHRSCGSRRAFQPRLEAFEERWMPAAFVVTDPVDSAQVNVGTNNPTDANGLISLRSAVAAAEADSANGKSDTITFSSRTSGFEFLVLGAIDLSTGSGTVTINGGKGFRISSGFEPNLPAFASDTGSHTVIKNVTFYDCYGENGGTISNEGNLTLSGCTFNENDASTGGALCTTVGSSTIVSHCIFNNNQSLDYGGAICNFGTMTVNGGSQFNNNKTQNGDGGAIMNIASLSSTNTTYDGNTANGSGGGSGNGGAIASVYLGSWYPQATLSVSACKFEYNSAIEGGAVFLYGNNAISNPKPSTYTNNSAVLGDNFYEVDG